MSQLISKVEAAVTVAGVAIAGGMAVDDASEEWRHECEARSILAIPTLAGLRARLAKIEERRGSGEWMRLQAIMRALWDRQLAFPVAAE